MCSKRFDQTGTLFIVHSWNNVGAMNMVHTLQNHDLNAVYIPFSENVMRFLFSDY
jgi:hypothetical protein